jgi:hypothetical protein
MRQRQQIRRVRTRRERYDPAATPVPTRPGADTRPARDLLDRIEETLRSR